MDKIQFIREMNKRHQTKVLKLIESFIGLKPTEQRTFILETSSSTLLLIIEVIYNYLKGKLQNYSEIRSKLIRFKDFIRNIVKRKLSFIRRRELLSSQRGIYILRNIFEFTLRELQI